MTYTIKLKHHEVELLVDALNKASARHASYARFYPGRQQDKHVKAAAGMTQIRLQLQHIVPVIDR